MAQKNILIVHNFYQIPGGEDTEVANEKQLLESLGHCVTLYTRSNSELREMSRVKKLLLPFSTIFNLRTWREIRRIIRQQKIDVVHVHNTLNLVSPSVYYAALSLGVPVVQSLHNFRMLCPGATFYRDGQICEDCVSGGLGCALRHRCYRGSRMQTLACVLTTLIHRMTGIYGKIHYICLTEFNREKLLQLNKPGKKPLIPEDHIFIKPNFTANAPGAAPVDAGKDYLCIGRVEEIKGIDTLLEAFRELPEQKLYVAGNGPELEKYRKMAGENVVFLGYLSRERLEEVIAGVRAIIAASRCYESFGLTVVEAYAAHKPVIAADLGNYRQLVQHGQTGLRFASNDPAALRDAVLAMEAADASRMGENGYKLYQSAYSPERNGELLEAIYDSVIRKQ